MPRKPGIYRKVKQLDVDALVVDLKNGNTFDEKYQTPFFKDKNICMKYLEKTYNNNRYRVVKVKKMVEKEVRYFLSIESYLKYAKEIKED